MSPVIFFAFIGLIVSRGVDLLRHLDKAERVPKGWWLAISWGLGIGAALIVCNVSYLADLGSVKGLGNCANTVLSGIGFGSVAGFWHEVLSALSAKSGPAPNQKGYWNSPSE